MTNKNEVHAAAQAFLDDQSHDNRVRLTVALARCSSPSAAGSPSDAEIHALDIENAGLRNYNRRVTVERDLALKRVAELEHQRTALPITTAHAVDLATRVGRRVLQHTQRRRLRGECQRGASELQRAENKKREELVARVTRGVFGEDAVPISAGEYGAWHGCRSKRFQIGRN